jgi:alkanesulfonate monooxygenase SsuD/methylene tetrahydromethanopterin reductase-like flavin-dependent oxidoreductase (luciferase family)
MKFSLFVQPPWPEPTAYFGTPDQMVEWIRHLRDVHQVQYFGVNMDFGLLTHAQTMRSIELFATEVMPKFRP